MNCKNCQIDITIINQKSDTIKCQNCGETICAYCGEVCTNFKQEHEYFDRDNNPYIEEQYVYGCETCYIGERLTTNEYEDSL